VVVPIASADLSTVVLRVDAQNSSGAGFVEFTADQGSWNGDTFTFDFSSGLDINDEFGQPIARLNRARFTAIEDPQIGLIFDVTAGNIDTVFSISSGLLSFPAINPAEGTAAATVTLTDAGNNGGALLAGTGGSLGNRAYLAEANGLQFAALVGPTITVINSGGSQFGSGNTGGFQPMGSVSNMQAHFNFGLTANDSASGTSIYVVRAIPEPATIAMLVIAAGLIRRR